MNKELDVLRMIEENEKSSQREFARILNVSLGTANAIVQKLITDGFVELISFESKGVNYRITPKGKLKKAELLYNEVISAYDVIAHFKKMVRKKLEFLIKEGTVHFFLYGDEDDIYRLIKMALLELRRFYNITFSKTEQLIATHDKGTKTIVWNQRILKQFKKQEQHIVYILE